MMDKVKETTTLSRLHQSGLHAQSGDIVQEYNITGRVVRKIMAGRVPLLLLENDLYVSQKYSIIIGVKHQDQQETLLKQLPLNSMYTDTQKAGKSNPVLFL